MADAANPAAIARTRLVGGAFIVASALCVSIHSCAVRLVSEDGFSTPCITFWVGVVRLTIALTIVPFRSQWRPTVFCTGHAARFVALVAFRQLVGVAALGSLYAAFARMPLGEATALCYTAPIWTNLLARLFLHEPLTHVNLGAAILACGGVGLLAVSTSSSHATADDDASGQSDEQQQQHSLGTALALVGAALTAGVMVSTRAIGNRLPAVVSSGWYGFSLIATSLPWMAALGLEVAPRAAHARSWATILCSASVSFGAQVLLIMGLQRLEAGPGNVLATLEIVFSFTWQVTILGTASPPLAILGTAVIIVCAAAVSARERLERAVSRMCGARPDGREAGSGERGGDSGPTDAQAPAQLDAWFDAPAAAADDGPTASEQPVPEQASPSSFSSTMRAQLLEPGAARSDGDAHRRTGAAAGV